MSGRLRDVLVHHTTQRMRHYFLFLITYRMLLHLLNVPETDWKKYVSAKATHQCDSGLRRDRDWQVKFLKHDTSILDLSVSAFARVDAAHFCNLGLTRGLDSYCARSTDPRVRSIYEALTKICGNTRWLPQRINIGPDRVVDRVHGFLCYDMLDQMAAGRAAASPAFVLMYRDAVVRHMTAYAKDQHTKGNVAVSQAGMIYVETLSETVAPTEVRRHGTASKVIKLRRTHIEEVWDVIKGNAAAEFYAHRLDRSPKAELSMLISTRVA